jgi:hypothetical protein
MKAILGFGRNSACTATGNQSLREGFSLTGVYPNPTAGVRRIYRKEMHYWGSCNLLRKAFHVETFDQSYEIWERG